MAETITVWLVRVIQIELDDGEYFYQQIETNERFGPFPTVAAMTEHMREILVEDIVEAIGRQYN
jgi:hypothetical protein